MSESKPVYKITVEMTRLEEVVQQPKWERMFDPRADNVSLEEGETCYGYTPQVIKTESVTRQIYCQSVQDLDIKAVINAVNNH